MSANSNTVRILRVFVSSPDDVRAERDVLTDVIASINRTDGEAGGFRLETFRWEDDVTPQIGPKPQAVIDDQLPPCEIYVGIMSARFGTPAGRYGSGTEKEFKDALRRWRESGRPWLLFYFNAAPALPTTLEAIDQYRAVVEFRGKLQERGITGTYRDIEGKDGFRQQAAEHLRSVARRLLAEPEPEPPPPDVKDYLRDLAAKTSFIEIRGVQVGKGRANRLPIEELFISLTTTGESGPRRPGGGPPRAIATSPASAPTPDSATLDLPTDLPHPESHAVPLHTALRNDRLVVVGDPGAGKTTFLRRVTHALCQTHSGEVPQAAQQRLGIADRTFPIFLRLSELADHLERHAHQPAAPAGDDAPAWLPHYLGAASAANAWGLSADFFRQQLEAGQCTVLLDGLDEAPDRRVRERLSRLIENVTRTYGKCRFVVTSRPAAYTGDVVLPEFAHARIDPLSDEVVEAFLGRWCQAIYVGDARSAGEHLDELLSAVRARREIRRMARNPVMLTALAVVHWNERRLPEQRADLYDSILRWLSRSREQRPGRETADRTVVVLQELALAMQDDPAGRKTQVPKRWAAEKIAAELSGGTLSKQTVDRAERFLDEEELDSGIVVGRGHEVAFWHLTFQEFMAAKAIAARLEDEQERLLFADPNKLYLPDWREVGLLLAGSLHQQGKAKVDGLVSRLLDGLGPSPSLADRARCAGLVGGLLRDLAPLDYQVSDPRYATLMDAVQAIFDRQRSQTVPIEERIAAADAMGQAGDPRIDFTREDYWASIPAGTFWMGSQKDDPQKPNYDPEMYDDEGPVHEVYLDAYRIARYPVTVGQFQRFVEDEGYEDQTLVDRWGLRPVHAARGLGCATAIPFPSGRLGQLVRGGRVLRLGSFSLADRGRVGASGQGNRRPTISVGQRTCRPLASELRRQ